MDLRLLNKKCQIVIKCCHYNKYLIKNMAKNDSMDICNALYVYKFFL